MGPIALHGGGEFLPGDERFVDALLDATATATRATAGAHPGDEPDVGGHAAVASPLRVVVLPTAAARGRPDLAAATALRCLRERARTIGCAVETDVARVVDEASADDTATAELIASADLIHLPGGDPDLVPLLLGSSASGRALVAARTRGAVIAGASAGAMALAEWSWTPKGGVQGLGFVAGIAVVPHYDDIRRLTWQANLDRLAPDGIGYLGLDERTGVISDDDGWRVAGEGAAYWFPRGRSTPRIARHGEHIGRFD